MLQTLVKRGFKPPEMPGARLESLEAGIVHSSAIGVNMDVVAAVRAISTSASGLRSAANRCTINRHGEAIAMPRDIAPRAPVDTAPRAAPKKPS